MHLDAPTQKPSKVTIGIRSLYGLIFVASSIAFFMTKPPEMPPGPMADFFKGMQATGFFFYLLKGTEFVCGLLLLAGMYVPLALVILAPVVLHIFLVHVFMAPEGIAVAVVLGAMQVYLSFFAAPYRAKICSLFER